MDEMKAINRLSIMQKEYKKYGLNQISDALQIALDDIALVINLLAIYNDDEMHEDYLLTLDDVIKEFIVQRSEKMKWIIEPNELSNADLVRELSEVKCKLGQDNPWQREVVDEAINRIMYLDEVKERIHTMVENLKKKGL